MFARSVIVGIAGSAGSGKDYFANALKDALPTHRVKIYKFATPIKEFVRQVCFWDLEHTDGSKKEETAPNALAAPRQAMQWLGTEWGRRVNPELWVDYCFDQIYADMMPRVRALSCGRHCLDWVDVAIISDLRFKNEAEAIKAASGIIVHLGDVSPLASPLQEHTTKHASEAEISTIGTLADVALGEERLSTEGLHSALDRVSRLVLPYGN